MGSSDISSAFAALNAAFSDEDGLLRRAILTGRAKVIKAVYLDRLVHSFWVQDYDATTHYASLFGDRNEMIFGDIYRVFYEGIAALRLALRYNNDDRDKWISVGEDAVSTFQTWRSHNTWNFENKHLLLSAELHQVKRDFVSSEKFYKESIVSAQKHKFVHEEGLAIESLGMLYNKMGKKEDSIQMLSSARSCYVKWGAVAVIERLDSLMDTM